VFAEISANGASVSGDTAGGRSQYGNGIGVGVGYGFTSRLAVFASIAGSRIRSSGNERRLTQGDLVLRFHFSNARRSLVPFVDAGICAFISYADEVSSVSGRPQSYRQWEHIGSGGSMGTGFHVFRTPTVALTTTVRLTRGSVGRIELEGETLERPDYRTTNLRLSVGVTVFQGLPR
jgi:hypothetical protein